MGESSGEQPKVKGDTTKRELRRWEDRAVALLGAAVIALVCWMWQGLSAQITRLEEAKNSTDTRVTVVERDVSGLKHWLEKIDLKLDKALEARK